MDTQRHRSARSVIVRARSIRIQLPVPAGPDAPHTFTATARRQQIIAATIDTIAELGYGQATFARIAERAGLSSTRLISYHFEGKAELMSAAVAEVYGRLRPFVAERMTGHPDARGELHAYITGSIEFIAEHRVQMQALMAIFLNLRTIEGGSRFYNPDNDRNVVGHVESILSKGQANGEFRDFDTFVMAATIQRSIDGLPFLLQSAPDLDLTGYARELTTLFDLATRAQPARPEEPPPPQDR
ncbi:TetR/AcrR family transcriptional regulator [Nonomuraea mesophila]|uniref:TetR/AcrR family transcriptional regulator n=1 Tax=Nonomuraea mesophila TaxID=2530382 RepID=A0A4R5F9G0_9ACTN|nr:TetR/AcrR family transcriptional regulator [Nonomuraea mesophila]TDE44532.1 TetR/AcrR family transcriptional regulator [Nonomuraea mesophila]